MTNPTKHLIPILLLFSIALPMANAQMQIWPFPFQPFPQFHFQAQAMPTPPTPQVTSYTTRWVGYSIGFGGNVSYITANWIVESVSNHPVIQWIGIQSINGKLVQIGISSNPSGLKNSYQVFYERWPNEDMMPGFNVSVGDRVSASITKLAPNESSRITEWNLYLKDITLNKTLSETVAYNIPDEYPEWDIEAPYRNSITGAVPLGNFKNEEFTGISTIFNGESHNLCNSSITQDAIYNTTSQIINCTAFSVSNPG